MIQELLPMLPQALTSAQSAVLIGCAIVGALLWLMGATFSRAIVVLIAVGVGGFGGEMLPRWYILPVNSMAMAVLGAVALGVVAAWIPRLWVGRMFGLVVCAWTTFGMWVILRGDFVWPERQDWEVANMTLPERGQDMWQRLPDPVRRVLPYAAATAMISGLSVTLLWPRVGRVLMCSCLGLTLLIPSAVTLISIRKPDWLMQIPSDPAGQYAIFAGMILLGALIEWQLLPAKRHRAPTKEERAEATPPI